MRPLAIVEAVAALAGVAGAAAVAVPGWSLQGFMAFAVSNVGWLMVAARRRVWTLAAQQAVFLLITIAGLVNWWRA